MEDTSVLAVRPQPYSLLDYYTTSVEVGLRSLFGKFRREAAARIINPLSYPRLMEYELTLGPLGPLDGLRVLDIGSPKLPMLLIARDGKCELYSTDIRDYFIGATSDFLRRLKQGPRLGRDVHLQVQDARHLTYQDAFFDRIFSISVLEHIPDDGDSSAMREIARVLKPGGLLTLTVPFSSAGYHEEFLDGRVYERGEKGQATFYQRHHDMDSLRSRLIEPSGLTLLDMTFFGEPRVPFERYWNRIPMKWKAPLLWAQPFLARLLFKQLQPHQMGAACGVALVFQKSAAAPAGVLTNS
jgi:SAM-dependent methyltransferase